MMTDTTLNPATVAEVGAAANTAATIASVATGNPEIQALTQVAVALGTAIANIVAAQNGPALTSAEMQTAWTNMGASLGAALKAYNAAK